MPPPCLLPSLSTKTGATAAATAATTLASTCFHTVLRDLISFNDSLTFHTSSPLPENNGGSMLLHSLSRRAADIRPNERNTISIISLCIFFVFGFVFWHLPVARDFLAGFKLFVVGWHELCHLMAGVACGGEVLSICIDPNQGGCTRFQGLLLTEPRPYPNPDRPPHPPWTLTQEYKSGKATMALIAGYLGSVVIGGVFIFCGFDITASKICSFFIGLGLLVPLSLVDHWIPIASILSTLGLMIGLWWGDHGEALRYFVLFTGILHLFYVVWDYSDERFFDKANPSDCNQYEDMMSGSASSWACLWFLLAALVLTASVIGGIAVFKRTPEEVYEAAGRFLPT